MTSIEWLIEEMLNKGFFKESVTLTNIDHLQYKAEEMHNKEIEISDEEIKKAANNPNNDGYCFQEGAKWYREQLKLKQPKKD